MKKVRTLQVYFEEPIEPWELELFRGAVAGIVGGEHVLFHNHLESGFRYSYPAIQYKMVGSRPMIFCLGDGVEEVHHFFREHKGVLLLNGRSYNVKVHRVKAEQFVLQVFDCVFHYKISKWHPLNQSNYVKYKELHRKEEKLLFLENILKGNILAMAKGVGWSIDNTIKLEIAKVDREDVLRYKRRNIITISASFSTNVSLPQYIGLGSHTSVGYGMVTQVTNQK